MIEVVDLSSTAYALVGKRQEHTQAYIIIANNITNIHCQQTFQQTMLSYQKTQNKSKVSQSLSSPLFSYDLPNNPASQVLNSGTSPIECYLMRHAESKFNEIMNSCQHDPLSAESKAIFQLDQSLIDCGITQKGVKQIDDVRFQNVRELNNLEVKQSGESASTFDIVFVSPLNRTLQTARLLLQNCQNNGIRYGKVIVLKEITEVVSKVCDFGEGLQEKIKKYKDFDFSKVSSTCMESDQFWQDQFVDQNIRQQINKQKSNGSRYIEILSEIFPKPLQSVQRCLKRSIAAKLKIQQIARELKAKRILVITHNRILKNILTEGKDLENFKVMENCQIRKITL